MGSDVDGQVGQANAGDVQGSTEALIDSARTRRADLRKAMITLERALARPAPGRVSEWSGFVHDALVELSATFERHIAVTEGESGFLAEIAEHSPRLINAIERIHREHERISGELTSTLREVRRLNRGASAADIDTLREHVMDLVTDLARHRQHGADLVYEAHAVDIGGSD